jgi:hypothetical protein
MVSCSKCNRPTWAGCGAHVEQVLGHVPPAERCQCREAKAAAKASAKAAAPTGERKRWWSRS